MGWRKVERKQYDCDGCGKPLKDPEFETTVTFPLNVTLFDYDVTEDAGWLREGDKAYCPDCWHSCEGTGQDVVGSEKHCHDAECREARR